MAYVQLSLNTASVFAFAPTGHEGSFQLQLTLKWRTEYYGA